MKTKKLLSLILAGLMIMSVLPISALPVFALSVDYSKYSILIDGKTYSEATGGFPEGIEVETKVETLRKHYYTTITLTDYVGEFVGLDSTYDNAHHLTVKAYGTTMLTGYKVCATGYPSASYKGETWNSCVMNTSKTGYVSIEPQQDANLYLYMSDSSGDDNQCAVYSNGDVSFSAQGSSYVNKGMTYIMHYSASANNPSVKSVSADNVYLRDLGDLIVNYILTSWKGFCGFSDAKVTVEGTGDIVFSSTQNNMSSYVFSNLEIKDGFDAGLYVNGCGMVKAANLIKPEKNSRNNYVKSYSAMWGTHYAIVAEYATGHTTITSADLPTDFPYPVAGSSLISQYNTDKFYAGIQWTRVGDDRIQLNAVAGQEYKAELAICPKPGYSFANIINAHDDFLYINESSSSYNTATGRVNLTFEKLPTAENAPVFTTSLPATALLDHNSTTPYVELSVEASNATEYKWYYVDADNNEQELGDSWYSDVISDKSIKLTYDPAPKASGKTKIVCYALSFGKTPARTEVAVDFNYGVRVYGVEMLKSTMKTQFPELSFEYYLGNADVIYGMLTVKDDYTISMDDNGENIVGIDYSGKESLRINFENNAKLSILKSSSYETNDAYGILTGDNNIYFSGEGLLDIVIGANDGNTFGIETQGTVYFEGANVSINAGIYAIRSYNGTTVSGGNVFLNGAQCTCSTALSISSSYKPDSIYVGPVYNKPENKWNGTDTLNEFKSVLISNGYLSSVTVRGVTAPVEGATPDTEFSFTEPYLMEISNEWYNVTEDKEMTAADTFVKGNKYSFTLKLVSLVGSLKTDYTIATINGYSAKAETTEEGDIIVTCEFIASEAKSVNSVAITKFNEPTAGETYMNSDFSKLSLDNGTIKLSYSGYRKSDGTPMEDGEAFVAGKEYSLYVFINPVTGKKFDDYKNMIVTINGSGNNIQTLQGSAAGQIAIIYTFKPKYELAITGITEPVLGEHPSFLTTELSEANGVVIEKVIWKDAKSNELTETSTFEEGAKYDLVVVLKKVQRDDVLSATVNGKDTMLLTQDGKLMVITGFVTHIHSACTEAQLESLAETDEDIMEAYFAGTLATSDCQNGTYCCGCNKYFDNGTIEHKMVEDTTQYVAPEIGKEGKKVFVCEYNGMIDCNGNTITCTHTQTEVIPALTEAVTITAVSVTPATANVQKGKTQQFTASVSGTGAYDNTVTWTVTGGIKGTTINADGLLSVAAGETAATLTVTATSKVDSTKSGTATVTVTSVPVTKYILTVENGTGGGDFESGAVVNISAAKAPAGQQFKNWTVETGKATITDANAASTTLTMTTEASTVKANYEAIPVSITDVSVTPATANVQKGKTQQFTASVSGTGAYDNTVTWTVTGGVKGTTINADGLLSVAAGETAATLTVTATSKGDSKKSDTATVTVTSVPVTKYTLTIENGTGGGDFESGAVVNISAAKAPAGQQFKNWTTADGGSFANADSAITTYTMSAKAATVTANYEPIPATEHSHTWEEINAVASNCAQKGNNHYWHCTDCGKYYKDNKTTETTVAAEELPLDENAHDFSVEVTGKDGVKKCKNCGKLCCNLGDVDGDGTISSADARLALRQAVKLEELNGIALAAANADGAEDVTAADARLILRASVKLEDTSKWEKVIADS